MFWAFFAIVWLYCRNLYRHEGGMPWFHQTLQVADLVPTRLRENRVGKVIEEEGQERRKIASSISFVNFVYNFQLFCRCFRRKSTKLPESTTVL